MSVKNKDVDSHYYGPLARYEWLIKIRNRKVSEGISLHLFKDGHETKGLKK
jgi:hypothetical protein